MKSLRQLGFLKLSLRPDGAPDDEDHRVLALFRNRAELKKAYGDLQEEIFRLKDLIKQQEAATQRVQDMLAILEGRLGAAETAYPALVFYQLRRLWQSGRELIASFIADLSRQQEDRERRAHLAQHTALEADRARLTRFWHYFGRRALERRIAAARAAVESAGGSLGEARKALDEIGREGAPEFEGLSQTARRSINLAAIAYAEVL